MDSVRVVGNCLDVVEASSEVISSMYSLVVFIEFDVDSAVSDPVVEVCLIMGSMVFLGIRSSVVVIVDNSIVFMGFDFDALTDVTFNSVCSTIDVGSASFIVDVIGSIVLEMSVVFIVVGTGCSIEVILLIAPSVVICSIFIVVRSCLFVVFSVGSDAMTVVCRLDSINGSMASVIDCFIIVCFVDFLCNVVEPVISETFSIVAL